MRYCEYILNSGHWKNFSLFSVETTDLSEKIQALSGQFIGQIFHSGNFFTRNVVKMYPGADADGAMQGLGQSSGHAQGDLALSMFRQTKQVALRDACLHPGQSHSADVSVTAAEQALHVSSQVKDADIKAYPAARGRKICVIFHDRAFSLSSIAWRGFSKKSALSNQVFSMLNYSTPSVMIPQIRSFPQGRSRGTPKFLLTLMRICCDSEP
jgi:hypothetical protein